MRFRHGWLRVRAVPDLLANSDMDMAVVIKLKTHAVDTELLVREIHQVLKVHHASHELEAIERECGPGHYSVKKKHVIYHVQESFYYSL